MLEEFGITKTEEKVYLVLSQHGSSTASDIIKKTQLHRTTVYDVLDRLIEKGVVSFVVQNKIKYYSSINPSKFLDIALEQQKQAEAKQELAKKIISEINSLKKESESKSTAQVFVGVKGQKTIMNDIIEEGKDFVEFGAEGKFEEGLSSYTKQWAEKRIAKNIKAKIIFKEGLSGPKWKMNQIRYVSKEYQSPASTIVYGNKVAIFIHEEPITIILIESKKLSESYRNYFNLLWKLAKQ
jgi:HTH-type transcriptional regulator, sugar sensing transcriptional regulator